MTTPAPTLDSPAEAKSADRLVRSLSLAIFLQWLGASAILPLLPLYLRQKGGSDQLVGVVMGAYFVASLVSQYPAGRLADRIGRRTVLLGGLVIYAAGSMGFLLPVGPAGDIALRALQGCGAGCAEVAALAMVAGAVPLSRRGRAFGSIYRGQLGGMAVGPLIGSLIGVGSMDAIFVGAGLAAFAACVPVLAGKDLARHGARDQEDGRPVHTGFPTLNRSLVGAVVAGVALGLTIGVYEACWTLLLDYRGAEAWQVGLSWTLFAAPFALMARPGGWIADHFDRRRIVVVTILVTLGFCATYPWLGSIAWLLGLGAAEACGVAIALPSIQSLLTQGSEPSEFGPCPGRVRHRPDGGHRPGRHRRRGAVRHSGVGPVHGRRGRRWPAGVHPAGHLGPGDRSGAPPARSDARGPIGAVSATVPGCLACDLSNGRRELPGGLIYKTHLWVVEPCVGPLNLGTLIVKPARHVTAVADLTDEETAELGPLLRRSSWVAGRLVGASNVYNCLWSHATSTPVHIHYVVQPVTGDQVTTYGVHGPALQVAMFAGGPVPDPAAVAHIADRARLLFAD